jgi:hypothetical protein
LRNSIKSSIKENLTPFERKVICAVAVLTLLMLVAGTVQTCATPSYAESGADSVTVTREQADSLLTLIEAQDLTISLLRVDLWEMQQKAALDSSMAATIAAYRVQKYEALLEAQRPSWYSRLLKSPELWLVMGVYLGIHAAE